jgi:hypothetical protein
MRKWLKGLRGDGLSWGFKFRVTKVN